LPRARSAALVLAILTVAAGWTWNTKVAGGADSYGYVSQAVLWRHGALTIDQPFVADVPWPLAADTFSPLGYRPSADHLVPIYSPRMPMLMAAAVVVGGSSAMFWVVPLAGGVLVLATFAIGRAIAGAIVGLIAAAIVATSPTFLYMVVQPMSDVPAAAAWAAALACVLTGSPLLAAVGGLATSLAILIRPNLAPIAIVLAVAAFVRSRRALIPFVLCAVAGPAIVGVLNARLHGSPFASGYDLTDAFSLAYVLPNLARYGRWLLAEPALVVGLCALAFNLRRLWALAAIAAIVLVSYLVYVPFDAWWFLRYLLPAWPMLAIGAALVIARAGRAALALVAVVMVAGVWQAGRLGAFDLARAEAKYVDVAQTVRTMTSPRDVIISRQHSGSLRYYGDRLTLRWDFMDPLWLDRAVEWLSARGQHVFLVLDADEVIAVRERFGASGRVGRLDWPPAISYANGVTVIYEGVTRDPQTRTLAIPARRSTRDK
jgi:hypothetical protein